MAQDLPELTDAEWQALVAAARAHYAADRYPLAPRLRALRTALAKLDERTAPLPPPLEGGPGVAIRRRKARR